MPDSTDVARMACSLLLTFPDDALVDRFGEIAVAVAGLPPETGDPLTAFLDHMANTRLIDLQAHFVAIFDMRRRACPYLTYWTEGETRNRGMALVKFKQTYAEYGFELSDAELPDHLAVVLEFAAAGDRLTGDAMLAEYAGPIGLLREALASMESPYVHVLDAVLATLPELTGDIRARMVELAAAGPPVETVGMEPYPTALQIGVRR